MKKPCSHLPLCFAAVFTLTISCALADPVTSDEASTSLSHTVPFELGDAEFAPGDNLTILQVRGTSDTISMGGTYSVEGTYTLGSRDEADLAFFSTSISNSGPSSVDSKQHVRIKKGTGSFHLIKRVNEDGYLHVSFYSGNAFGGVYFGQGNRVLHRSPSSSVSSSGPNRVLIEYLGNPVEPPANMDARYKKEGLISAIQLAARNAGITVKKVAVDDSEYPFLVGVICEGDDFSKLKNQIKKMDGYEYNGSVGNDVNSDGSDTCNVFSIVPDRAYPQEAQQQIDHRRTLRQQVFYDKLMVQE
jgi:hypothetical protein